MRPLIFLLLSIAMAASHMQLPDDLAYIAPRDVWVEQQSARHVFDPRCAGRTLHKSVGSSFEMLPEQVTIEKNTTLRQFLCEFDGACPGNMTVFATNRVTILLEDTESDGEVPFVLKVDNNRGESDRSVNTLLLIVTASFGTTKPVFTYGEHAVYHNDNGVARDFRAHRLRDDRLERGVEQLDAPMDQDERSRNMIQIVIVPLQLSPPPEPVDIFYYANEGTAPMRFGEQISYIRAASAVSTAASGGFDRALLQQGEAKSTYRKVSGLKRDTQAPIRVIRQYYAVTDDGDATFDIEWIRSVVANHF